MNVDRDLDFERVSQAWLAEGPTELADRVLAAVVVDIHRRHQRRHIRAIQVSDVFRYGKKCSLIGDYHGTSKLVISPV